MSTSNVIVGLWLEVYVIKLCSLVHTKGGSQDSSPGADMTDFEKLSSDDSQTTVRPVHPPAAITLASTMKRP